MLPGSVFGLASMVIIISSLVFNNVDGVNLSTFGNSFTLINVPVATSSYVVDSDDRYLFI